MNDPLELRAEVTTADGTRYRWGPNQRTGSRPRNLSFSTKIGEGFSSAQLQLRRRIDLDYPDLQLVNDLSIFGADGSVAWEGRMSALPRELGDTHGIGVTATGWMSHARDRPFTEIYIDRDQNAWQAASAARRAQLLAINYGQVNGPNQSADPVTNEALVSTSFQGNWASPYKPIAEAWYDAGSCRIGQVTASWQREGASAGGSAIAPLDANWWWEALTAATDTMGSVTGSGTLRAAGPGSVNYQPAALDKRHAVLQLRYEVTPAGVPGATYGIGWSRVAVYGLPLRLGVPAYAGEPGEPYGFYASDVIRDIVTRFCPQLSPDGIQATSYVIQHLAFKEQTDPYDALLEVNKYHLWQLAVWEDRTLHFEPYDLTDYDWEIRTDDPGVTFSPQGPGIDDLWNGVVVTYQDALSGMKVTLTPDTNPTELSDSSQDNPWVKAGVERWGKIDLSTPTIKPQALELGRAALGDHNTAKTPGTITVRHWITDRQGNRQPVWKVRAGDTISVTNFPADFPRLIVETQFDDAQKQVSLSIDRPFALLDAYLDRANSALNARGLG